ncbi:hypothetical protein GGF46_003402 [Coemansia sp. RSA 552]|nr:hypothetical protein GGF46_003402 [Coemansia sp. RSA 552]
MTDKETLLEFGFPEARVDKALKATKDGGLQAALDWLDQHAGDEGIDEREDSGQASDGGGKEAEETAGETAGDTAQSLKCNDCGKLLRDSDSAQAHAIRTGHTDFAQSTEAIAALTEEERQAKVAELQERIREKRRRREAEEKAEQRRNEMIRRKAGQDAGEQQERLKEEQLKRDLELQRRQKDEDRVAEERIKRQIEQDKRDRAARLAKEKAEREGRAAEPSSLPSMLQAGLPRVEVSASQTRLQIRPMLKAASRPLTGVFGAEQTLKDVVRFVRKELPEAGHHPKLSMTFPRKDFDARDEAKTLKELGLVPNAALILTE